MELSEEINRILRRIEEGQQTDEDINYLRQRLLAGDRQLTSQLGKYNVNIGEGKEIHIGDRIYYEWNEDAIKALIKAKSEDIVGMVLKPPIPSNYNEPTWVGREAVVSDLLPKLQGQTRLLWITGISGIGKTALGECLACQTWKRDPSFQWIYLEILEGQSPDFVSVAADLLGKLGDIDIDPQLRNNPDRLAKRLLQKLQSYFYWIQMDSLERLLNYEQPTEFIDPYWATFLQRVLTDSTIVSRLVLTAQAFPTALLEFNERYPNYWYETTLRGLSAHEQHNEHLELLSKNGIIINESNQSLLSRIGQIYEGHPLVLQVIAKEILALPFNGNVTTYWQRYGNEFEQVARELQTEQVNPALHSKALKRQVRRRVEISLKRLPTDALDLLCRSSVYRRAVPETFWFGMINDSFSTQQEEAYEVLGDRALVEKEGIHQGQFLIRQHNLIRSVAYDLLKADTDARETSERQAAHLWLTDYKPAADDTNLEKVRGYLEAFHHYCEVREWESASNVLVTTFDTSKEITLPRQLELWGYYKEGIQLCQRLLNQSSYNIKILCLISIGRYYQRLSEYRKAIEFSQQSFELAHEISNFHEEEKALINIGFAYNSLGEFSKSIQYCEQALIVNKITGNCQTEVTSLGNIGFANYRLGNYSEALKYFEKGLDIAKKIDDYLGECRTRLGLGNVNCALGKYSDATKEYKQALLISRNIKNPQEEAYALGNLGNAYFYVKKYFKAIKFHKKALKISQMLGDRQGEAIDLGNIADAIFALGNFDKSLEFYHKKLYIASEINERTTQAYALFEIGKSLFKLKRYSESLTYLNNSLKLCQEICIPIVKAEVLKNLAELHQSIGEVEAARQYCQQSLALATELGIPLIEECRQLEEELEKNCEENKG